MLSECAIGLDALDEVELSDERTKADAVGVGPLAAVSGTRGSDFIHVAGDGEIAPPGYNDRPTATDSADTINGRAGNDVIRAGDGNDTIYGEAGDDTLYGGLGADNLFGGVGNDVYYLDDDGDVVVDSGGELNVIFSTASVLIPFNVSEVTLTGDADASVMPLITTSNYGNGWLIQGNRGDNVLCGNYGPDTIRGGDGNDTILGQASDQYAGWQGLYYGDAGDDYIDSVTGYDASTIDGGVGNDTMVGSWGDTFIVDSVGDVVLGGPYGDVQSSVSFTLPQFLIGLLLYGSDDISGYGNDERNIITGNSGRNSLSGAAWDDTLDGAAGIDTLIGGTENDTYYVDNELDVVVENVGEGTVDLVNSSADYRLGGNVEDLYLSGSGDLLGTGNALWNRLTGNAGDNDIDGKDGDDSIKGSSGDDTLRGGKGNDTLNGGDGADVLAGGLGRNLASYAEAGQRVTVDLAVVGVQTGNGGAAGDIFSSIQDLEGSRFADELYGDAQANNLIGGAGSDTLIGRLGDDNYFADFFDTIVEEIDGGYDSVTTTANISLAANVERLFLTGSATLGSGNESANQIQTSTYRAVRLEGRGGDDSITGGYYNDTLDGGEGIDLLEGGSGNDSYYVDSINDVVRDYYGALDQVFASMSFVLPNYVENLILNGLSAIDGTGNVSANLLQGDVNANRLSGLGGSDTLRGAAGNDTLDGGTSADQMIGGTGDDTYFVDALTDALTELVNEGSDAVVSSVSFTLAQNFENLTLSGPALTGVGNLVANTITGNDLSNTLNGGGGADVLNGEYGNDSLVGETGADTLNGGQDNDTLSGGIGDDNLTGGQGVDVLTGGTEADVFVFRTPSGTAPGAADRVTDFNSAEADRIDLSNIDADLSVAGNQAFVLGGSVFSGTAGELIQVAGPGGLTLIRGDMTGDGVAEFVIELDGAPVLTAADFIL